MVRWTRTLIIASLTVCSLTGCGDIDVCMNCFKHDAQKPLSEAQARSLKIVSRVESLPSQARNVYFDEMCGMDCQQIIRFDLPADIAHDVMQAYSVVEIGKVPAREQTAMLRAQPEDSPLGWWLTEAIPNAEGVSSNVQVGQLTEFILVPNGKDMRVYMRAFSM